MAAEQQFLFGSFRLDPANARLWRDGEVIAIRPKTFDVLCCLVERAGQLVTKEEILAAVWPGARVSEAGLKRYIQEIRLALGDNAESPRFIETVPRRGYRFLPAITTHPVRSSESGVRSQKFEPAPSTQHLTPLVGRTAELTQLHGWLAKALSGERQLVFVTGEPGIGKTALVEAFLSAVGAHCDAPVVGGAAWVGQGQCLEHYGPGEAYLPVLTAFGRLCREPGGEQLVELFKQHAPTWLVQMPALLMADELEALQRKVQGATRERMLRELAEALEVLTAEKPLVLCLEDLHWSDHSTLDLLSFIARRKEPARLLVLGTYRPTEMLTHRHPLHAIVQELQSHRLCEELPLSLLSEAAVGEYLAVRFPVGAYGHTPLHKLARVIHQRTEGNPLFMVNVVDALLLQGMLTKGRLEDVEVQIPARIRHLIERQMERLTSEEQAVLEVASIAGAEFSAAAVAAGVEMTVEDVEARCNELVRRNQFLRVQGISEWPDGTLAARYGFLHALYQQLWHERVTPAQLQSHHLQIAERKEKAYGERAREIATELAVHFEQGRDYQRTVQYLQQAGVNAVRRSANPEAISLLSRALELLKTLPDSPERIPQELRLQIALGAPLMAAKGYAAPEVEHAYARARELCRQVGETPQLFPVLYGLCAFSIVRAEYQTARELGEQLLSLAQSIQSRSLLVEAHQALGQPLFFLSEFSPACEHFEQSLALYDPQTHNPYVSNLAQDPGVACLCFVSWLLWLRGYPDQALKRSHEALALAHKLSHPFSLAYALVTSVRFHFFRREVQATQAQAETLIALCAEQRFALRMAQGTIFWGWTLAMQGHGEEGIAQVRQGMTTCQTTGAGYLWPSFLALLAEAYGKVGQAEEGLSALSEALTLVNKTGERFYEAELYRLKGQLVLQSRVRSPESENPSPQLLTPNTRAEVGREAEECFHKAIDIARKQQAKSWELRATTSLARLWQQQGKRQQAHRMLAEIYGWFTEGFDTVDLKEAKVLLEELGH